MRFLSFDTAWPFGNPDCQGNVAIPEACLPKVSKLSKTTILLFKPRRRARAASNSFVMLWHYWIWPCWQDKMGLGFDQLRGVGKSFVAVITAAAATPSHCKLWLWESLEAAFPAVAFLVETTKGLLKKFHFLDNLIRNFSKTIIIRNIILAPLSKT